MNLVIKSFFVLMIFAFVYVFFSFVAWEFNPEHWHDMQRFLCAFASTVSSVAIIGITWDVDF